MRETAIKVAQRNAFFAHPENVMLAMLGDDEEEIRRVGVNKVEALWGSLPSFHIPNGNFKGGYVDNDDSGAVSCLW